MNSNKQKSAVSPYGGQYQYGGPTANDMPFGEPLEGTLSGLLPHEPVPAGPAGFPSPWAQPPAAMMPMPFLDFGMSTTPVSTPPQDLSHLPYPGSITLPPTGYQMGHGLALPGVAAGSVGPLAASPGPSFPATVASPASVEESIEPTASSSSKKQAKPSVMMRARRKERKTPAKPFAPSRPLIPILDSMTSSEQTSARAHNTRVAAERKENERRRNNQSAKRARIRKMATAVSLADEINRLRGEVDRARAEAELWKNLAYQRDGPGGGFGGGSGGNNNAFGLPPPPPMLPPRESDWAKNPLGPPPQGQHVLEGHYADEVADMRRCLKEYVRGEDLAEICTSEFHEEIAAVVKRGDEILAGLSQGNQEEDNDQAQPATAAAANEANFFLEGDAEV